MPATINPGIPVIPPTGQTKGGVPTTRTGGGLVQAPKPKPQFRVIKIENDAVIGGRPITAIIQTGTVTISLVAAAEGTATVTFDRPFEIAPRVMAIVRGRKNYNASTDNVTTTDFDLAVRHEDGTGASVDVAADWMAI